LDCFIQFAPFPLPRETDTREVSPEEKKFSGFVFKIHANIDPRHRNRIAFLRICSGTFERNKRFLNVTSKKQIRCSNPTAFMAQEKEIIDTAYPGDIVGLHDTGNLKIGDTLTEGESMTFKGIPNFSPEIFKMVVNLNPLKTKQLDKGLLQLCEEGVAQFFTRLIDGRQMIGTVGALQFEVIQYRLEHEYGAQCRFEPLNFIKATWITSEKEGILDTFINARKKELAKDNNKDLVFLAETQWSLDREIRENPDIKFHFTSDSL
jgi:peptide chain release factor 3